MTTLKAALQEAYFMELEEMPSEEKLSEDEALTFSSAFERKMKKLIRRADHPIRYRIAQAVACLLLAALLSGCTVLAISPEARAAFVGWVREVTEGWFVYHYTGEDQIAPENVVYCPTWVPDGYELITEPENRTHMIAIYENPEGDAILFNCYMNTESMNLHIGEDTQLIDTYVSTIPAELYVGNTSGDVNHLIWEDENKQMIFWIASTLDGETMVKIAESVEAQEVPKPQAVYCPTWVPDGYELTTAPEAGTHSTAIYENPQGDIIIFNCSMNTESINFQIEHGDTQLSHTNVGDISADLYIDNTSGNANYLVWENENRQMIFWIISTLNSEKLIKIAESVEAVQ